jgi:CBS domain-containing protein
MLLVLTGCSAITSSPDATATERVTPAPVPDTPGPQLAPGTTADGVVDPAALVAAHHRTLADRSYRRVSRTLLVDDGDEQVLRNETRLYDAAAGRATVTVFERDARPNVPTTRLRLWTNGTVVASRTLYGADHAEYAVWESEERLTDHGGDAAIETLADQPARVVDRRTRGGTTEFVLVANETSGVGPGEDGRLVGVVTAEGVLRSLTFESRRTIDGRAVTYRIELRYEPYEGRVARTAWVEAALASAGDRTPDTDNDTQ